MPHITYNSGEMASKISEIVKASASFNNTVGLIEGYIKNIQEKWTGTDADAAKSDFETIRKDLTDIANNITTINTVLSNVQSNMSANKY